MESLLADELQKQLPPLDSEPSRDPMVYIRYFNLNLSKAWYVVRGEAEGNEYIFYGYIDGPEPGWDTFTLNQLKTAQAERDLGFTPTGFWSLRLLG